MFPRAVEGTGTSVATARDAVLWRVRTGDGPLPRPSVHRGPTRRCAGSQIDEHFK